MSEKVWELWRRVLCSVWYGGEFGTQEGKDCLDVLGWIGVSGVGGGWREW